MVVIAVVAVAAAIAAPCIGSRQIDLIMAFISVPYQMLAVLVAAEWSYQSWAELASRTLDRAAVPFWCGDTAEM